MRLFLPKAPKNLELLYQLKEKEAVKKVEREIADRIENLLEEGTLSLPPVFRPRLN